MVHPDARRDDSLFQQLMLELPLPPPPPPRSHDDDERDRGVLVIDLC
jgi:hypothetical protein